ncbi:MAG: cupredoxin domain-containing protein [Nitrospiraceae bacterium]|nr:cupredoxin domain-containing protein [Nitrospiraceae bacterium]
MKQQIFNRLALTGVPVLLAAFLYSCGGGGGGGAYSYGGSSSPAPPSTVQLVSCPPSGTTDVSIVSIAVGFSPASITVPVNTTVKWTNTDTTTHTVSSTTVPANGAFDVQVNPGAPICLKFTAAGTFNYHCAVHPTMPTGMVIVQ